MDIAFNSSDEVINFKDLPPGELGWSIMLIWTICCVVVAFFGNFFVFFTSMIYNSIQLDKISRILIRHIALSNLGFSVYLIFCAGTLTMRRNLYPDIACSLYNTWGYLFLIAELLLAAALGISRLTWILQPLYAQSRSGRHGHKIAAAVWTFSVIWCVVNFTAIQFDGQPEMKFRNATYLCATDSGRPVFKWMMRIAQVLIVTGTEAVLIVTTLWLLCFLRMKMKRLQKQAFVTTLLISSTYLISFVPYAIVYKGLQRFVLSEAQVNSESFATFYRISKYLTMFNCAANPIVYYFTIRSYGNFVRRFFVAIKGVVREGKFQLKRADQENSAAQFLACKKVSKDQSEFTRMIAATDKH